MCHCCSSWSRIIAFLERVLVLYLPQTNEYSLSWPPPWLCFCVSERRSELQSLISSHRMWTGDSDSSHIALDYYTNQPTIQGSRMIDEVSPIILRTNLNQQVRFMRLTSVMKAPLILSGRNSDGHEYA